MRFERLSAHEGGGVVFKATGADGQSGLYFSKGGDVVLVADLNMDLPTGRGKFMYLGGFAPLDGEDFLFFGEGFNGQIGSYKAVYKGK